MLDILSDFQLLSARLWPAVLVVPGVLITVVGICVWLGGLYFRKLTILVLSLLAGLAAVALSRRFEIYAASAAALITAIIAGTFNKSGLVLFGGFIVFIVVMFGFTWSDMRRSEDYQNPEGYLTREQEPQMLEPARSAEIMKSQATVFLRYIADEFAGADIMIIAGAVAAGAAAIGLGLVADRFAGALTSAVLGTAMIWAGMFLLLCYKGSKVVEIVSDDSVVYGIVTLSMVAFGTTAGLLLCPENKKKEDVKSSRENKND